MVGVGRPLLPEILGQPTPIGAKLLIFNRYSPIAPQPQHLAKKVQLTLIASPLRTF